MDSLSTRAFGQPSDTKPTRGAPTGRALAAARAIYLRLRGLRAALGLAAGRARGLAPSGAAPAYGKPEKSLSAWVRSSSCMSITALAPFSRYPPITLGIGWPETAWPQASVDLGSSP